MNKQMTLKQKMLYGAGSFPAPGRQSGGSEP